VCLVGLAFVHSYVHGRSPLSTTGKEATIQEKVVEIPVGSVVEPYSGSAISTHF
jgi:hypothetical protein